MNHPDEGWEQRMADRAAARRAADTTSRLPDRETWPVPPEIRSASARDAFLWYICDGWNRIFGDTPAIEELADHDFGYHVLRKGPWQLTLVNVEEFPHHDYNAPDGDDEPVVEAEPKVI